MAHDYACQKLYEALDALVGSGTIQMRLTYAAVPLLSLRPPQNDLPAEVQGRFETLMQALTAEPLSNTHDYIPRPVTDERGAELAREILSFYTQTMGGL